MWSGPVDPSKPLDILCIFWFFHFFFTEEILYTQSQLGNNAQNKHQRVHEQEALKRFKQIFPAASIQDGGLFIHEEIPFLGASPFKLVGDDHILAIKCPLKLYQKNVNETRMQIWTTKDHQQIINTKSAWYIEQQGDMQITNRKWTYLFIWLGENPNQHQLIEIKRDNAFFSNEIRDKLVLFYNEGMLKELANPRKDRGLDLRQWDEANKTFV